LRVWIDKDKKEYEKLNVFSFSIVCNSYLRKSDIYFPSL